jgi:hypothetical protein
MRAPHLYRGQLTKLKTVWFRGRSLYNVDPGCVLRITFLHASGWANADISRDVRRTRATVGKVLRRACRYGGFGPPHGHGGRRADKFGEPGRRVLLALVRKHKTASLERYAQWMSRYLQEAVTRGAVSYQFKAMGISRKKLWVIYSECASSFHDARAPPLPRRTRAPSRTATHTAGASCRAF